MQVTTDSQGRFTTDLANPGIGEKTITVEFTGDDYYTASTVTRTITVSGHSYAIALTPNTSILQSGNSISITATLTDIGVAMQGETLSYQVKHGTSVIDSGTDTTDSNGQIDISYTGTGIGDVTITVTWDSLEQTGTIEDVFYYDTNVYTSSQTLNIPSNISTNFKLEFDVYIPNTSQSNSAWVQIGSNSSNCLLIGNTGSNANLGIYVRYNGSTSQSSYQENYIPVGEWVSISYTYQNGEQTITCGSNSVSLSNTSITGRTYGGLNISRNQIRNIKFRVL